MGELIAAVMLATRDLLRPGIAFHAVWPPLAALIGWGIVAVRVWSPAKDWVSQHLPDWNWLTQSFLGDWLASAALMLVFAPFVYFTTLALMATFALPRMMAVVAASDYPDVARRGRDAVIGSLINTLGAGLLFLLGWLATLPLLLIPGVILILPIAWTAWLNQRTFRFDALAEHATSPERHLVIRDARSSLYGAGLISSLLAHIPILNFFAPAWTALLFVHLCLLRLRRLRSEGVVWDQPAEFNAANHSEGQLK